VFTLVLVTGCNRGIGLELVRQLLDSPKPLAHLFATYRDPGTAQELLDLAKDNPNLHPLQLDVTDTVAFPAAVSQVASTVGDAGLNVVINNAGMMPKEDLDSVTPEDMLQGFQVNCVAPLFLSRALLPLLKIAAQRNPNAKAIERAALIQMSTLLGSIAMVPETSSIKRYSYRCSKAALNMAMKSMAVDLEASGVLTLAIHPGWVKTDMGGPDALITTQTSVKAMLETLNDVTEKDHGSFITFDNKPLPW